PILYEYRKITARSNGASSNVNRFSWAAASRNSSDATRVNPPTNSRERSPAGIARILVRGFSASSAASAHLLKAMPADLANTIHAMIQNTFPSGGQPFAASMAPVRANGSAKMECSHLIISSVVPIFRQTLRLADPEITAG